MVGRSLLLLITIFALTGSIVNAETNSPPDSDITVQTQNQNRGRKTNPTNLLMSRNEGIVDLKYERESLKNDIQEKKLEMRQEIQAARAEYKASLKQIKDARKKTIIESVDQKLIKANQKSTDHFLLAIVKLENLLKKFSDRASLLKQSGKDTSDVDAAIVAARDAISDAKNAVSEQAAKEYTFQITDESTLKANLGQTMKLLRSDLKATHDVVKLAKQKVIDVARALAKLKPDVTVTDSPDVSPTNDPSSTPSVSPTVVPSL